MRKEIDGNLITLALAGEFDVIVHGCNCMCTMGAGIAPQMAKAFGCDQFPLERVTNSVYIDADEWEEEPNNNKGDINKLGQIDYQLKYIWGNHPSGKPRAMNHMTLGQENVRELIVVNAYTQYDYRSSKVQAPFDYEAFTLCMRKINRTFEGKHLGMPMIGSGLAGGSWTLINNIIGQELTDLDFTIVKFVP